VSLFSYLLGDALGNADSKRNLGIDGLVDGRRGEWRWNVNHCRIGSRLLYGLWDFVEGALREVGWPFQEPRKKGLNAYAYLLDRVEHREIEMLRAPLAWRDASHHLRAIFNGLLAVKGALDHRHGQDQKKKKKKKKDSTCLPVNPWQMTRVSLLIKTPGFEAYSRLVRNEGRVLKCV